MKRGDFHIHSNISDGEFSPEQIVALAKLKGLSAISISDHNSIDGVEEAIEAGKKAKVKVIPAVELSTRYKSERIHILGYFFNKGYKEPKLKEALRAIKRKRAYELNKILDGKIKIKSGQKRLSVEEGIKFLKLFNAKIVLAHPVKIKKECFYKILDYDFDGIEAIHSKNKEGDSEFFIKIAKGKKIFYTGGSDFHNFRNPGKSHGIIGEVYIEYKEFEEIFSCK